MDSCSPKRPFFIYTGGSILRSREGYVKGGYGVVCESDKSRNTFGWFVHGNQTKNRYELEAIKKATEDARDVKRRNITIRTGSKYVMDSLIMWLDNWRRSDWKKGSGKPIKNRELIMAIDRNISHLRASGKNVRFEHILGDYLSNQVDRLAECAANFNPVFDSTGYDEEFDLNSVINNVVQVLNSNTRENRRLATNVTEMSRPFIIYTDGSTLSNGKESPKGGYGVVCKADRSLDTSGSFTHGKQTNNRYELEAIKIGTEIARDVNYRNIIIMTDSRYAMDSLTIWLDNWKQNGWRNASGKPVKNSELIEDIDRNLGNLRAIGKNVEFEHVRGHQSDYYNNEADRLARVAAENNPIYGVSDDDDQCDLNNVINSMAHIGLTTSDTPRCSYDDDEDEYDDRHQQRQSLHVGYISARFC